MRKKAFFAVMLSLFILPLIFAPTSSAAAALLSASSTGNGVFQITGSDMTGVASMDITLSYDAAALANPSVTNGPLISGALTAVNANSPGLLRIGIIRTTPFTGSGTIATVAFGGKRDGPGALISMTARLSNVNGAPIAASVRINNPAEPRDVVSNPTPAGEAPTASARLPLTTGAAQPIIPFAPPLINIDDKTGGTSENDDVQREQGEKHELQAVTPDTLKETDKQPQQVENAVITVGTGTAREKRKENIFVQKSVFERFKEYRGPRTPDALISLFNADNMIGCRQEPQVAFADGRAVVTLAFVTGPGELKPADLTLTGVRLISLKRYPSRTDAWLAELLPEKGKLEASLSFVRGDRKTVYPITISPKIDIKRLSGSKAVADADFNRYVKGKTAKKTFVKLDLNGDGKRDYKDDYIFTANYIVALQNR